MAIFTWTGTIDGDLSKEGNYDLGSGIPIPGDTLVVPIVFLPSVPPSSGSCDASFCNITSGGMILGDITFYDTTIHILVGGVLHAGIVARGSLNNEGEVTGGIFPSNCDTHTISNAGTVSGGRFDDVYTNSGTISGGVFNNAVNNSNNITGGTFNWIVTNDDTISGNPTFNGNVINNSNISGGIFNGNISGTAGHISGGTLVRAATFDGNEKFSCNTGISNNEFDVGNTIKVRLIGIKQGVNGGSLGLA